MHCSNVVDARWYMRSLLLILAVVAVGWQGALAAGTHDLDELLETVAGLEAEVLQLGSDDEDTSGVDILWHRWDELMGTYQRIWARHKTNRRSDGNGPSGQIMGMRTILTNMWARLEDMKNILKTVTERNKARARPNGYVPRVVFLSTFTGKTNYCVSRQRRGNPYELVAEQQRNTTNTGWMPTPASSGGSYLRDQPQVPQYGR
jgi:hypothetical protein